MTIVEKIENRIRSERKKHHGNYWIKVCSIKLAHDFEFLLKAQKKELIKSYEKQVEVIREQGEAIAESIAQVKKILK